MFRGLLPDIFKPGFWKELGQNLLLAWKLLRDPRVPLRTKTIPLFVIFYILSPFDLVPFYLPVIGQLDDFALLLLGMRLFVRLAPPEVVASHQPEAG